MSFDTNWNIDKYREDHECDEHWQLRRAFLERWKDQYSEERLVCLARVFANIEFMGCRYPPEVMAEVSRMSQEIAKTYRGHKKNKLQRTFVSASDAAEDRAKGIKRVGGVITEPPKKSSKIQFVAPGTINSDKINISDFEEDSKLHEKINGIEQKPFTDNNLNAYMSELNDMTCLDICRFRESMFHSIYGKMVLVVRPWMSKMSNISASCQTCNVCLTQTFNNGVLSLSIDGNLVAQATGDSKADARAAVEQIAWNKLKEAMVIVLIKQQFVAHNDSRISVSQIASRQPAEFGKPIENSVAAKMMKLMGWKGGGLGSDAQGIEEPIKPNFQMVDRAGLGSTHSDIRHLRKAASDLMRRYIASDTVDLDLVFANDFSKEERAQLHKIAASFQLGSRSYGSNSDRFLVVQKRLNPFGMVKTAVDHGGSTQKFQVFIPAALLETK